MTSDTRGDDVPPWLRGGGAAGELMRSVDWSTTSLGVPETWPAALRTMVGILLTSEHAMFIYWGSELVQFYNDAYRPILGSKKHPAAMGQRGRECWAEVWHVLEPMMAKVWAGGAAYVKDGLLLLDRHGFIEECYFDYAYTPIRDETGRVAGIFVPCGETTRRVLGERRLKTLGELGARTTAARTDEEACAAACAVLSGARADIPFALVYLRDGDERASRLVAAMGIELASVPQWAAAAGGAGEHRVEADALAGVVIEPGAPWPERPEVALVLPLRLGGGERACGHLVVGVSPRLILDDAYLGFLRLVAGHLCSGLQNARAYSLERSRVEKLAELDRAKTAFFANVSHELRTPLTLILGPVEDAATEAGGSLTGESLQEVHRNAVRLLRLVNSLLDFARIEESRFELAVVPTDLERLTIDLASSFGSLVRGAGLSLVVDCSPLPEPVSVDPSAWEKIVLNLLSNAFKFTLRGEIRVSQRWTGAGVELRVADTGCGIPAEHLPRVFERFHRVGGARGRSFEGTGIGLSLVHELVRLHGGTIVAASTEGAGSVFTVTIPRGNGDASAAGSSRDAESPPRHAAVGPTPYLLEAAHWISADTGSVRAVAAALPSRPPAARARRVLVVDDNPDMRAYLTRLLASRWDVAVAADGEEALASARERRPDIVLSDVMMPRMTGLELLRELRTGPSTRDVPVVLLSARAGEEALVGGLDTGADDYLVKPFSARELLARVQTHLEMAELRRRTADELQRANEELEAFSYSVSHDLRAPLRAIDGFSRALLQKHGATLDAEARHYLERVRSGTQRMAHLIDDLLGLSRIARAPLSRAPVNVTDIAEGVVERLRHADPDRTVAVTIARGMTASADARLVEVLVENLIANAWKFTSKTASAEIVVGVERRDGGDLFFVRDNGAGFDQAYASKLFTPFQRMHSDTEFEGTGIGLATVRRIAARHGGRAWAEAAAGLGATFFFTLEPTTQ